MHTTKDLDIRFDWHVGVAVPIPSPTGFQDAIRVFAADYAMKPALVRADPADIEHEWTLHGLASWLGELVESPFRFLVGINHRFSFPIPFLQRRELQTWSEALRAAGHDDSLRESHIGFPQNRRQTERWGNSLTCMFGFKIQGLYADAGLSDLSWLELVRDCTAGRLHIWPFDGWIPPQDRSVLVEFHPPRIYSSFPSNVRREEEENAYAMAKWLAEADELGILPDYFWPDIPKRAREAASVEGWILGVH